MAGAPRRNAPRQLSWGMAAEGLLSSELMKGAEKAAHAPQRRRRHSDNSTRLSAFRRAEMSAEATSVSPLARAEDTLELTPGGQQPQQCVTETPERRPRRRIATLPLSLPSRESVRDGRMSRPSSSPTLRPAHGRSAWSAPQLIHPLRQRELLDLHSVFEKQDMVRSFRRVVQAHYKSESPEQVERMCAWTATETGRRRQEQTVVLQRKQQVREIFTALDTNGDGTIDEIEFSLLRVLVPTLQLSRFELIDTFREYDTDDSGGLDVVEFGRLVDKFDLLQYSQQIKKHAMEPSRIDRRRTADGSSADSRSNSRSADRDEATGEQNPPPGSRMSPTAAELVREIDNYSWEDALSAERLTEWHSASRRASAVASIPPLAASGVPPAWAVPSKAAAVGRSVSCRP